MTCDPRRVTGDLGRTGESGQWPGPAPAPDRGDFAPTVTSTIVVTVLFSVFGVIPAIVNSRRAAAVGGQTRKYWVAFWWSLLASVVLWAALWVALVIVVFATEGDSSTALGSASIALASQ